MGMVLVVILEPPVKRGQHSIGIRQRVNATAIGDDFNMVFKIRHRLMLKDILEPPGYVRLSGSIGGQSTIPGTQSPRDEALSQTRLHHALRPREQTVRQQRRKLCAMM